MEDSILTEQNPFLPIHQKSSEKTGCGKEITATVAVAQQYQPKEVASAIISRGCVRREYLGV